MRGKEKKGKTELLFREVNLNMILELGLKEGNTQKRMMLVRSLEILIVKEEFLIILTEIQG